MVFLDANLIIYFVEQPPALLPFGPSMASSLLIRCTWQRPLNLAVRVF